MRSLSAAQKLGLAISTTAVVAGVFFGGSWMTRANAGLPADKVTVAGSTLAVVGAGQTQTILSATMKTSSPEDLVLQLTSECSIVTQVFTSGTADHFESRDPAREVAGRRPGRVLRPGEHAELPGR